MVKGKLTPGGPPPHDAASSGSGLPEKRLLALEIRAVTKAYPGVVALSDVDFDVRRGETHGLLGENGAGKSTLIKIMAGAEQRDSGELVLNGQAIPSANPARMRALGISVIYQELSLVRKMDVASNIFLGRERVIEWPAVRAFGIRDRRAMMDFCRRLFAGLGIDIDPRAMVGDLSVSDMQLIEIARAVAFNAHLILMDEPTTSIGASEKARLFELIGRLKGRGLGIVYVSHVLEDCMGLCDRITVLRDGRRVATVAKSQTDVDGLIRLITGRTFSERYPRIESKPGRKLLEVRNLTKGSRVRDVSFDLHEGEIIGFAGLVGAGRTDLMQSIFGLERADSGEIVIDGERVVVRKPRDAIRRGFSLLTEDRKNLGILPNMTVRDNIVVTLLNLKKGAFGQGLTWLGRILRFSRLEELAHRVVRELNVKTPSTRALIVELSGGNQQKTLLGRALSAGARIIILDEPTKGVDAGAKIEIYRMLQNLVERKLGVIVVSSELPEVMAVAHRIVVMKNGRLTTVLSRDTTSGEEIVRHATT